MLWINIIEHVLSIYGLCCLIAKIVKSITVNSVWCRDITIKEVTDENFDTETEHAVFERRHIIDDSEYARNICFEPEGIIIRKITLYSIDWSKSLFKRKRICCFKNISPSCPLVITLELHDSPHYYLKWRGPDCEIMKYYFCFNGKNDAYLMNGLEAKPGIMTRFVKLFN